MNAAIPVNPVEASRLAPCLIVNPKSFRMSNGGLAARALALGASYGAELIEASHPDELCAGLERVLARGPRRVIVLSGDGTVHAIVDYLANLPPGSPMPELMILGGGRTNLTAADLRGSGGLMQKLESALRRCRDGQPFEIQERDTLTVEQSPAPAQHGFFVAGGFVDDVIRDCHHHRGGGSRSSSLREGHFSTFGYLLRLALLSLIGRCPIPCPVMDVRASTGERLQGPSRVLIASTLLHRERWFDPYADRGRGRLRVTSITASAPGFWLALLGILRGRFGARLTPERGYLSGRCDHVDVLGMTGYSLDGEDFDTDPARNVRIGTGPRLRFLMP